MRALYEEGLEKGRTGSFWRHTVPAAPTTKETASALAN
jgi:hypothetical protein